LVRRRLNRLIDHATKNGVIPAAATLVFDDTHAASGSDFDVLLAAAVREVPPDVAFVILSRQDPAGVLLEDLHLIEYTHVRSNGCGGILIRPSGDSVGSIVQNNAVQRNGGSNGGSCSPLGNPGAVGGIGIAVLRGSVSHNIADVNVGGIVVFVGTASYNVVTRNLTDGLDLDQTASYIGNVMNGNSANVVGGTNLGQNLCNNAVCPGASF